MTPETNWMMNALSQWLRAPAESVPCSLDLDPDRLGEILEKNRLLPLFQRLQMVFPAKSEWSRFRERIDLAYQRSLLQGLQQVKSGQALMDCLAAAGIQSLVVRGPFLAEDVYGDPALRMSSDVDVLVSFHDRRRAWKACRAAGYRSLDRGVPLWPFDNHRIHWRLQREGDPVVCELHWAVEPVYGVMTLDYEAFLRSPSPSSQFLLLCLHAGEHVLERFGAVPSAAEAVEQGMLFRWLDVAMFLRKYGAELDWDWLDAHARDRRAGSCLSLCLNGVRDWFGWSLPSNAEDYPARWAGLARAQESSGIRQRFEAWWERRAGRALGLETSMPDVLYYLWPQAPYFGVRGGLSLFLKRAGHAMKAGMVLTREALSYACFALAVGFRRLGRAQLAAVMTLVSLSAFAHEFNDDYGDTPAAAYPLTIGSNITGRIEIDVDEDWFSFQASASTNKEIVVAVTTGTLWNSTAGLAAPDGIVTLAYTDSVASVTSRVSWIHVGPPATYYVRVAGFASFTTGTYTLAVTEQLFRDDDHDGMPDSWEVAFFGNTNQPPSGVAGDADQDGSFNIDEFLAGTNPTNLNSRLRVTGFSATNGAHSVSWAAVPYRYYDIEASTNLAAGGWDHLGTVSNLNALGTLRYDDPATSSPIRFYRVRCVY